MLHSLLDDLGSISKADSIIATLATNLYFLFAINPSFKYGDYSKDHCCKLLARLCELGSSNRRSIIHKYCESLQLPLPESFDPIWLEEAATDGSYFAVESLRTSFKERYHQWQANLTPEYLGNGSDPEREQKLLLDCCRAGNFLMAKALLEGGASATPIEDDSPSALHWLVSFRDDTEVVEIAHLLLRNGAILDFWLEDEDDLLFGKVQGTPLHWAIWHRNMSAIRILTEADPHPAPKNRERAVVLASALHFHDVLNLLNDWSRSDLGTLSNDIDMNSAIFHAVDGDVYDLVRLLRHGESALTRVMLETVDILFNMQDVSKFDDDFLHAIVWRSILQNKAELFRFLVVRLDLVGKKEWIKDQLDGWYILSLGAGFLDVFDVFFEHGLLTPDHRFGKSQLTCLQTCFAARQRNPVFTQRFLDFGCPVDEFGGKDSSGFPSFGIAVQNGQYECATLLLRHGADKDLPSGWLGGTTPTFRLLQTWPDLPVSRLRYLLEEIVRLGFGHVNFIGWPGYGGNLLYPFATGAWAHYRGSYRFTESIKYVLSMFKDTNCLNETDRLGCTALKMAAQQGNLEVCRILIDAGADVNAGFNLPPLNAAMEWLKECKKKENLAAASQVVGERRHIIKLRARAEECVNLLKSHGAKEQGSVDSLMVTAVSLLNGNVRLPSPVVSLANFPGCLRLTRVLSQTLLETISGFFDSSPAVNPGAFPLHPTQQADFRIAHGQMSALQSGLSRVGRVLESVMDGQDINTVVSKSILAVPHGLLLNTGLVLNTWLSCAHQKRPPREGTSWLRRSALTPAIHGRSVTTLTG